MPRLFLRTTDEQDALYRKAASLQKLRPSTWAKSVLDLAAEGLMATHGKPTTAPSPFKRAARSRKER